jgi:hypothetical protein
MTDRVVPSPTKPEPQPPELEYLLRHKGIWKDQQLVFPGHETYSTKEVLLYLRNFAKHYAEAVAPPVSTAPQEQTFRKALESIAYDPIIGKEELDVAAHWYRGIAARALAEGVSTAPPTKREPDGYAHRYPDGIRFGTDGRSINGSEPIEAIPLYYANPPFKPIEGTGTDAPIKCSHGSSDLGGHLVTKGGLTPVWCEELPRALSSGILAAAPLRPSQDADTPTEWALPTELLKKLAADPRVQAEGGSGVRGKGRPRDKCG